MRRSLLLALAAAALVAAPQAWAEEQHSSQGHTPLPPPRGGQHAGPSPQGQHPGPGPQGQHGWAGQSQIQPQGQHVWGGQPQGQRGWGGQSHIQPQAQRNWGGQPQGQPEGQRGWAGQPQGQHGAVQGGWGGRPGGQGQPAYRGQQTGRWNGQVEQHFDRRANPEQWGRTRNEWRGAHSDWDRDTYWRRNHDWWRGRPEFHGYVGPRIGFWFIPGVGYYQAPREYWGRHWGYGDYLPRYFWQYQVYDWSDYGLPPPPWGCAWIWIDGGVALVDLSDGYILDVEYGLW